VNLEQIARGTPGFVGADLQNLVNEAALLAARRDGDRVALEDFELAKDKVLLGAERKSMIMSDEDKRQTAYHEAGHALLAMLDEHSDPVHKVTIIPRGMALGLTQTLPEEDRYNLSKDQILAQIKHAMGGRAAEDLVFAQFTTGASDDLQKATEWTRRMVCKYGMSAKLGPVTYGDEDGDVFLGRDFVSRKDYSEKKAQEIDDEVSDILNERYNTARQTLEDNREILDRIAEALLERETLTAEDLKALVAGETLPPLPPPPVATAEGSDEKRPSKAPRPAKEFPGDKVPDPEPAVG
jgi:cell division protease FtsH